ncbi:hypothetical protein [Paenibacillus jiagnxiensis]|uniref:hypothetical protein n=1 Tax=Paenibacillus jiagnxiensis TaxID=3228926 RepID=UPI0033B8E454
MLKAFEGRPFVGAEPCGHKRKTTLHSYGGTRETADNYAVREGNKFCWRCEEIGFNTIEYLPNLIGSEKQVAWATKIRYGVALEIGSIIKMLRKAEPEKKGANIDAEAQMLLDRVSELDEAKWWIDHRHLTPRDVLLELFLELEKDKS